MNRFGELVVAYTETVSHEESRVPERARIDRKPKFLCESSVFEDALSTM